MKKPVAATVMKLNIFIKSKRKWEKYSCYANRKFKLLLCVIPPLYFICGLPVLINSLIFQIELEIDTILSHNFIQSLNVSMFIRFMKGYKTYHQCPNNLTVCYLSNWKTSTEEISRQKSARERQRWLCLSLRDEERQKTPNDNVGCKCPEKF